MSKGLEALKGLYPIIKNSNILTSNAYKTIEQELNEGVQNKQALEIIKNKRVDVGFFMFLQYGKNPLEVFNRSYKEKQRLTQEEYDLLKEVLL